MNNFLFENGTKAIFGKGCVKEYLACFLRNYGDTVMLAYGGGAIKKNGIYDEIRNILKAEGKEITEFNGIMANPTYEKVLEGAKLARENHVDVILAVGGGSVMDCCKAVSLAARYEGEVWDNFWAKPISDRSNKALLLFLPCSVVGHPESHICRECDFVRQHDKSREKSEEII